VRDYAEAIRARLDGGTMPCDGPWPGEDVQTFRRWIDQRKEAAAWEEFKEAIQYAWSQAKEAIGG
jgi:hypothetical protein